MTRPWGLGVAPIHLCDLDQRGADYGQRKKEKARMTVPGVQVENILSVTATDDGEHVIAVFGLKDTSEDLVLLRLIVDDSPMVDVLLGFPQRKQVATGLLAEAEKGPLPITSQQRH
jgi:hypothetical protein